MVFQDFSQQYFIDPIIYNTGYNPVNSTFYGIILIAAFLLTYKLLKKLKVNIDRNFFLAVIPFILLGSILRSLEDLWEAKGTSPELIKDLVITDLTGTARNMLLVTPI